MSSLKPYAKYKPSGVKWLGDVPEHWEIIRSRRLFTQRKEKAIQSDQQLTASQKHGVIYQTDFMERESQKVVQVITGSSLLKHVEPNDFVISMRSFQGGIEWCGLRGCISSAYVMLIPSLKVSPGFFRYALKCTSYIQALQSTSDLVRDGQALRFSNFTLVDLPLLSIDEQSAIATFLDRETTRIDSLVEKKQRFIELLKEKRQALITDAVTGKFDVSTGKPYPAYKPSGVEWLGDVPEHWEAKRLRYLASYQNSNVDKKTYEGQELVRLCNYTDVYYSEKITNDLDFMEATASDSEIESMSLMIGDVIITKDSEDSADIGIPAIVSEKLVNVVCGYHLTVIRSASLATSRFLHRAIQSDPSKAQFYVESPGITRFGLNQGTIGSLWIATPPKDERQKIASFLDRETVRIDALVKKTEKSIELLKERRSVLITAAVTGKIDVREALPC